jgi:hypothetical protein
MLYKAQLKTVRYLTTDLSQYVPDNGMSDNLSFRACGVRTRSIGSVFGDTISVFIVRLHPANERNTNNNIRLW